MNYYNEVDHYAAQWLRNLIDSGEIPLGDVDERDIREVQADDLRGYTQCHFFAGIGGWPLALRLAGVLESMPLWTGSCPCQPFSSAGKRKGNEDERHLWPAFFNLIRECRPVVVFGEQVESSVSHGWLDGISADLEGEGYAVGATVLGAHSVYAPHKRQRLFWVADSGRQRNERRGKLGIVPETAVPLEGQAQQRQWGGDAACGGVSFGGVGNAEGNGRNEGGSKPDGLHSSTACGDVRVGDSNDERPQGWNSSDSECPDERSPWPASVVIECRDNKLRRIPMPESGIQPLAHGIPRSMGQGRSRSERMAIRTARANRVGRLKGYGNAIVPQVAAEFIQAYMEVVNEPQQQ